MIADRYIWQVATVVVALLLSQSAAHANGPTVAARILSCYDGDTCTVDRYILPGRNRVRLRNADTAEIEAHCAAEKRLALQAKAFTSRLVGKVVTLGDVQVDKYAKRVDAFVIMPDGRDLRQALIAAGLARPLQRRSPCRMVRAVD